MTRRHVVASREPVSGEEEDVVDAGPLPRAQEPLEAVLGGAEEPEGIAHAGLELVRVELGSDVVREIEPPLAEPGAPGLEPRWGQRRAAAPSFSIAIGAIRWEQTDSMTQGVRLFGRTGSAPEGGSVVPQHKDRSVVREYGLRPGLRPGGVSHPEGGSSAPEGGSVVQCEAISDQLSAVSSFAA